MKDTIYITSRANPTVAFASSLKEKKFRDKEGAFLLEGFKLFEEAASMHLPITHLFIAEGKKELYFERAMAMLQKANMENIGIFLLSDACFEKISTEKAPQGIIAVVKHLDFFERCIKIYKEDIFEKTRALCLCSVRDPGNLGAIIRSAVAFGTDTLLLSSDCAELYNPKTLRAAMGGLFKLRVFIVDDLVSSIATLKECGKRVFAAELKDGAISLEIATPTKSDVFVIGNEGHGISPEVSRECSASVYIPIMPNTESLNAAVAASVLLYEQSKR